MGLTGKRIGFAITGSYCTIPEVMPEIENLVSEGNEVIPILSYNVATVDTRFGRAADLIKRLEEITGRKPITTDVEAEPIGPQQLLDVLVIAPCTGSTLSKLANAITDTPVLMAAKAHLRNSRPVVIAVSTNDGLGANAKNLGTLMTRKNIFFVPFGQDNPVSKPNSIVADIRKLGLAIAFALEGKQLQPVLVEWVKPV